MKKVTIKLKEPLRGPNNTEYTEVIIREPTVTEALRIGDPYVVGSAPSGAQLVVENFEAISEYTRICVVEPRDTALLDQGGVFLARELKRAVIDFFPPRRRRGRGIGDVADDLVFGGLGGGFNDIGRLGISDLLMWHGRAVVWSSTRKKR